MGFYRYKIEWYDDSWELRITQGIVVGSSFNDVTDKLTEYYESINTLYIEALEDDFLMEDAAIFKALEDTGAGAGPQIMAAIKEATEVK